MDHFKKKDHHEDKFRNGLFNINDGKEKIRIPLFYV